ncbi:hypothetical protein GRJ2_001789100 [Grus japonensis]|uniref:Uncharacterized protein n=1 Tax=Grus japonensis TaxID=30415 RepID=A0ABC9X6F3_GRUJA
MGPAQLFLAGGWSRSEWGINSTPPPDLLKQQRPRSSPDKAGGKAKVILAPFLFGMLQNMDLRFVAILKGPAIAGLRTLENKTSIAAKRKNNDRDSV